MNRLSRLLSLPRRDKALLAETALLLGAVRAGLCVLPVRVLRRAMAIMAGAPDRSRQADHAVAERVSWAVSTAGRHLPACHSCLVQALAAEVLLGRRGCAARLRIGVARPEDGKLQAHAWVESRGRAVVSASTDLSRLTPLRGPAEGGA
jgi:hypothetical protein